MPLPLPIPATPRAGCRTSLPPPAASVIAMAAPCRWIYFATANIYPFRAGSSGAAGRAARMPTRRARIRVADRLANGRATAGRRPEMLPEARKRPSTPSQAAGRAHSCLKVPEGRKGRSCASGAAWPWACRRKSCRHGLVVGRPVGQSCGRRTRRGMSVGRPVGVLGRQPKGRFSGVVL